MVDTTRKPVKQKRRRAWPPVRTSGPTGGHASIWKAEQYADDVLAGRVVVGRWVRQAIERHRRDLERSLKDPAYPYYFDPIAAARPLEFCRWLKHSKGEWRNKPFVLEPWQQFIFWAIFGWKNQATGYRRFREAYIEMGRKNGKTEMAQIVALYLADGDGEEGAEIYCIASDEQQAGIAFRKCCSSVKKSVALSARMEILAESINVEETESFIQPRAYSPNGMHGTNPSGAIVDEMHTYKDENLYEVLDTGVGVRNQPLMFIITTAGENPYGIGYEFRKRAVNVLEGLAKDDTFFAIVYALDREDKWDDPKVWIKANPNLGVSIKPDFLPLQVMKAKRNTSKLVKVKAWHFGIWGQGGESWLDPDQWQRSIGVVPLKKFRKLKVPCWIGLDMSQTSDLTAISLLFEWKGKWWIKAYMFLPEDAQFRSRVDEQLLKKWIDEGRVITTRGARIDNDVILKWIRQLCKRYNVKRIAVDPAWAQWLISRLQRRHLPVMEFDQNFKYYAGPIKETEERLLDQRFVHEDCQALQWQAMNVILRYNDAGLAMPSKRKSKGKIDSISAYLMAAGSRMHDAIENADELYKPPSRLAL